MNLVSCTNCLGRGFHETNTPGMSPTSKCFHCAGIGLVASPEFNTYIPNSHQVPMTALLESKDNQIKELEKEVNRRNILLQQAILELRDLKRDFQRYKEGHI